MNRPTEDVALARVNLERLLLGLARQQRRRLVLRVCGYPTRAIAALDGVTRQCVDYSIQVAKRKAAETENGDE